MTTENSNHPERDKFFATLQEIALENIGLQNQVDNLRLRTESLERIVASLQVPNGRSLAT